MSENIFKLKKPTTEKFGKGIFINTVEILEIEDISGKPLEFVEDGWSPDVAIKFKTKAENDIIKENIIAGDFARDKVTKLPSGLGQAFKILLFFNEALRLNEPELTDDGKIPANYLEEVIGKKIFTLDYVYSFNAQKGKPRFRTWDIVSSTEKEPAKLAERFLDQYNKGYNKKYKPELLDTESDTKEEGVDHFVKDDDGNILF